ncbi:TetR/AcrR family transcriptional regulator [Nocardia sp. NPDC057663]|uniref:TetR/AcrR family transcriptional regulator n=1 Tax=Nocardia sp. NPDC057663 TaxID=3346201 RepID=UPI00366BB7CA
MTNLSNHGSKGPARVGGTGRRRRADVLTALTVLLESHRLADIEVKDIAQQAGISRSNFYFYFPTKGAAVAALIADIQQELLAVGVDWYGRDDLADDVRIRRGMHATIQYWRGHARLIMAMFEAARENDEVRETWQHTMSALAAAASARIAENSLVIDLRLPTLSAIMVDMTARAMERDVASIVETGRPVRGMEAALVHVWLESTVFDGPQA